jgi:hypothetical protein
MDHPRMYEEADPLLAEIRRIFLAFPEAVEVETWGRPTFRAGKKIFGVYTGTDEGARGLIFKPDSDERASLLGDRRFYSPPYFGPSGWLALDLDAAPVDWQEVAELADSSYRRFALKRMLKVLDG